MFPRYAEILGSIEQHADRVVQETQGVSARRSLQARYRALRDLARKLRRLIELSRIELSTTPLP